MCNDKGIDFNFIPPRSPHFGGLWEAAVKSAKNLFSKSIATAALTYEELGTVMVEIEAILNSRPLTPMSEDPNDLGSLTPGHFLIGEPLTTQIDPHANPVKGNLLYRWKLVSQIKSEFWTRWSREYLNHLQQRHKWTKQVDNIEPGTMVVIKEDNSPVLTWPLGRIIQAIRGKDGVVRVADIKTARGIVRRAITNLAPLPVEKEEDCKKEDVRPLKRPPDEPSINKEVEIQPATKTRRTVKTNLATSLLMTFLVLPLLVKGEVNIQPLDSNPGLYFENLGMTYLITDEWNIVVYFDTENYWRELEIIKYGTQQLSDICEQIIDNQICDATMNQIYTVLEEIQSSNEIIKPQMYQRTKRSPLDIIGNVASSLFGVLDSDYAEKMAKTIENIHDNQEYFLDLIKQQTSIIDSTTNIIRGFQLTAERQINEFNIYINHTSEAIQNIQEDLRDQKLMETFNAISVRLILIITDYQKIQTALLDVVIDTHHGSINPLLLSPKQLQTQIMNIRQHLPATLRLPETTNNVLKLYKMMTISGRPTKNSLIFRLKVPLVTNNQYQMIGITPIPIYMDEAYVTIIPTSSILIVDLHRDSYYPLTEQELRGCSTYDESIHLCKQHHPLFRTGSKVSECEISILRQKDIPPSCKMKTSTEESHWIQLNNANQWIYQMKHENTLNIQCNNNISQEIIKGLGLITITKGCTVRDEYTTIQGFELYSSSIYNTITHSKNFSALIPPTLKSRMSYTINNHTNDTPKNYLNEILELKQHIRHLKEQEEWHPKHQSKELLHLSIPYISLILIIGIIIFLGWKGYQRRSKSTASSTNRQNPKIDFRLPAEEVDL